MSQPNPTTTITKSTISLPQPCPHLADFRSKYGAIAFRTLQECLRPTKPMTSLGRASIRRDPNEVPRCGSCRSTSSTRLYACITCASVHCFSHAASHAGPGHEIAVDVDRAELFCSCCNDQVYDGDFDLAVVSAVVGNFVRPPPSPPLSSPEDLRKRRRIDYDPWAPDLKERVLIAQNSSLLPELDPNEKSGSGLEVPWGLRGLNNLGSTCFMNSVLQALLHTPPLRNYFLSDKHSRYFCQATGNNGLKKGSTGAGGGKENSTGAGGRKENNNINARLCLACDLDALFSAVYSGDRRPYTPAKFLYSWWQHAANLATYEQQDAHEFFISILDGIHEKVEKDRCKPHNQDSGDCCIAHRVFSGLLRSDVICMSCGFTSTTYDPCIDISLDLEPSQTEKMASTKSQYRNGDADCSSSIPNSGTSTLTGCLDRFTRPERLGSDQKMFCQQCQVKQESLKQMSIRKLPLVSCFHIKRFEHSPQKKMSRKVDRYLQFPFSLDMAPYMSSSILRSRFVNRILSFNGEGQGGGADELSSEFELFAVITHSGKLNAGHYVTYLRLSNQWYKCDDAWITRVSETVVRAAQGYMMFYVQKMLYYKASERPLS